MYALKKARAFIEENLKDNPDLIKVDVEDDSIIDDKMSGQTFTFEVFVNDKLYANHLSEDEMYNTVVALVDGYRLRGGI